MNRIDATLARCRREERKALVMFLTAGDPTMATTEALIPAIAEAGADILEIGVPFSDPMADGPTIQAASERALASGANLRDILEMIRRVRVRCDIPVVLFSYYNVLMRYGVDRLANDSTKAGIDGWLVVDVPAEEAAEIRPALDAHNLHLIPLMAPTTPDKRARRVLTQAGGFVYYITVTGVTGARKDVPPDLTDRLQALKRITDLPVMAGFGVSSPEMARKVSRHADGVVVGSALINLVSRAGSCAEAVAAARDFVGSLARALRN